MLLPFSAISGISEVSIPYVVQNLSTGSKTKSSETGNVTIQESSQVILSLMKIRPIQFISFLKERNIDIPDIDYLNLLIGYIAQVLDIHVQQILQSMPAILQICCQILPN